MIRTLRAGLLGLGMMGRNHAWALSPLDGVDLVAVVDPTAEADDAAPPEVPIIGSLKERLVEESGDRSGGSEAALGASAAYDLDEYLSAAVTQVTHEEHRGLAASVTPAAGALVDGHQSGPPRLRTMGNRRSADG